MPRSLQAFHRVWSLVLVAACGGGGGDAQDRPLTKLTAAELDTQCNDWDSRVIDDPEALEGFCRIRGAGRALLDRQLASMDPVAVCEMEMQRCLSAPPVELCYGELRPECKASVDDLGGCVDAKQSQWRMGASRSCEEQITRLMNMQQAQELGVPFPDPIADACQKIDGCFAPVIIVDPDGNSVLGDPPSSAAGASGAGAGGMSGAGAGGAGAGAGAGVLMPDPMCMAEYPNPDQQCAQCVCSPQAQSAMPGGGCLELYRNCFENADPMFAMRCAALVRCTIEADCVGSACYAPAPRCMAQIDAAAMYPSGSTFASCGMGAMDSSPCRAATLLGACTRYDAMMIDGPCGDACE